MQLWSAPAANCETVTPEGRVTYPGASLEDELPRPSCPSVFLPQQTSSPSSPVEHAWADPASTAPASNPVGRSTMTAYELLDPADELPSCPSELSPQHATVRFESTAQPNSSPIARASDSAETEVSSQSSNRSQTPSPSASTGVEDELE